MEWISLICHWLRQTAADKDRVAGWRKNLSRSPKFKPAVVVQAVGPNRIRPGVGTAGTCLL